MDFINGRGCAIHSDSVLPELVAADKPWRFSYQSDSERDPGFGIHFIIHRWKFRLSTSPDYTVKWNLNPTRKLRVYV